MDGASDVVHSVENGEPGRHGASGRVDIHVDRFLCRFVFQIEQLRHHRGGHGVVYGAGHVHNSLVE